MLLLHPDLYSFRRLKMANWLSPFYYKNLQRLASESQLQTTIRTSYETFENLVLYDALTRCGCTQKPIIDKWDIKQQKEWLYEICEKKRRQNIER